MHLAVRGKKTFAIRNALTPFVAQVTQVFFWKTWAAPKHTTSFTPNGFPENHPLGAAMRSLTEQVTFKVSRDMLAILQERGRLQGLDANPYARKLVEEGLESDRAEHLADELRELLGILRPLASQLTTVADKVPASSVAPSAGDQIEQMADVVSQAANHFAQTLSSLQSELDARLRTDQRAR